MKKIIGKSLAAFLALLIMLSSVAVNVFAAGEPIKFSLSDASGNLGDTVDVTISVSGDVLVDFIAVYELAFDEDNLEYVGVKEMGELVEKCLTPDNAYTEETIMFTLGYREPIAANGTIAVLQFKIKDDCALKEMEVSMNAVATIDRAPVENGQQVPKCKITVSCAHDFGTEWKSDDKNHWHECSKCGEKDGVEAHKWDDGKVTTAPTCTEKGVKTYTCTVCSKTKTEEIPAKGHTPSDEWSKDADNHWHKCKNCGEILDDKEAHKWDDGKVTTEPTCTEKGVKTYTCTVCSQTKTEDIPVSEHDYDAAWKYDEDGHWHECKDCQNKGEKTAHELKEIIDKEPTEEEAGSKHFECTVCGYKTESSTIPALAHTHKMEHVAAKESTCTEKGNVEYWHCSKCGLNYADENGETEIADVTTPLKDHTYVEHNEVPADHSNKGTKKHYTCSVCEKLFDADKKETTAEALEIPVVPHTFEGEWKNDADGHWQVCECGVDSEKAAHTFDWTVVTEATEQAEGLEKGVCSVCEYETEREIPKKNHVHIMEYVPGKPATCVATGTRAHWRCTACNKLFADKDGNTEITNTVLPIDSANHQFNGNTCVACGYTLPSFNNMNNAPVYLSEALHGLFHNGQMIPYLHTPDFLGQRTDGASTWYVCGVCGHEYGKTAAVAADESGDLVQVIDVDTPTEAGDNAEEVEGDNVNVVDNAPVKSENPKTGITLSVIPAMLALLAIAVKKH